VIWLGAAVAAVGLVLLAGDTAFGLFSLVLWPVLAIAPFHRTAAG
jgi:hypothetical protein